MTHTLHRQGGPDARDEIIVIAVAARETRDAATPDKFRRFAQIVLRHHPVNFGDMCAGNRFTDAPEKLLQSFVAQSIVHAVFEDAAVVAQALRELKQAEIGLSIVVTGLMEQTRECCAAAGLAPHTEALSAGVFGRVERLPEERALRWPRCAGTGWCRSASSAP